MTIIKKQVIDRFNQGAYTYDAAADLQKSVARYLASKLRGVQAKTILEIGCGTGLLSQHLPSLFPKASLLLTDIAENMLEQCRARVPKQAQIKVQYMDGENLQLASKMDLIVSSMALQWFSDLKNSAAAIIKQLHPQGRFIFSLPTGNSLQEWRSLCETARIPLATPVFPTPEILTMLFPDVELQVLTYQQKFANPYAFLHSFKQLGSRATCADYHSLSAGRLRRVLREVSDEFTVTYEICYGVYTKS